MATKTRTMNIVHVRDAISQSLKAQYHITTPPFRVKRFLTCSETTFVMESSGCPALSNRSTLWRLVLLLQRRGQALNIGAAIDSLILLRSALCPTLQLGSLQTWPSSKRNVKLPKTCSTLKGPFHGGFPLGTLKATR